MSCATCANNSNGSLAKGCKNNGNCSTQGCNKLEVFDWLANMEQPQGVRLFEGVEVRFKNGRKGYYRNQDNLPVNVGDNVVVEVSPGHDVGIVSLTGELVKIQMQKRKIKGPTRDLKKIYRKATPADIDKWIAARGLEFETMHRARTMAIDLGLEMKISDVEYQGDRTKATFYYTADGRVDFRQLIKVMADAFKIRVEMRQIGARQESGRLGGVGSCGRELCCSTWLTDFRSVSTGSARYQQLSLNPQKLAGQCGKLKCCLNYELDSYLEAFKKFPKQDVKLQLKGGYAYHIKTDVFRQMMWFQSKMKDEEFPGPIVGLELDRIWEIIKMNENGDRPKSLKDFQVEEEIVEEPDYDNVDDQDDLGRFDKAFKKRRRPTRGKRRPVQKTNGKKQQVQGKSNKKQAPKGGGAKSSGGNKNARKAKPEGAAKGGSQGKAKGGGKKTRSSRRQGSNNQSKASE